MCKTDDSHQTTTSYLSGHAWVLGVSSRHQDENRLNTWFCREIEIPASYETTEAWNVKFWNMYLIHEPDFRYCVQGQDGIVVRTTFPFSPTVSFKDRYGQYSLSKIRRIAGYWRSSKKEPPPELAEMIAAYERDQALYDGQYRIAWQELMRRRLPDPPELYYWYHYTGGVIAHGTYFFRLWHPELGYEPQQE